MYSSVVLQILILHVKRLSFNEKIFLLKRARLPFSADQSYTPIASTTYTTVFPIAASRFANSLFRFICFTYTFDPYTNSEAHRQQCTGIAFLKL